MGSAGKSIPVLMDSSAQKEGESFLQSAYCVWLILSPRRPTRQRVCLRLLPKASPKRFDTVSGREGAGDYQAGATALRLGI